MTHKKTQSIADVIKKVREGVTITSIDIAEATGKRHDNVMRDTSRVVKNIQDADNKELYLTSSRMRALELTSSRMSPLELRELIKQVTVEESTYIDKKGEKRRTLKLSPMAAKMMITKYSDIHRLIVLGMLDRAEKQMEEYRTILNKRSDLSNGYNPMMEALHTVIELQGKVTKPCHEQNESRMVFKEVTGTTPSKHKGTKGLSGEQPRDYLSKGFLEELAQVQQVNTQLILEGESYADRKELINQLIEIVRSSNDA